MVVKRKRTIMKVPKFNVHAMWELIIACLSDDSALILRGEGEHCDSPPSLVKFSPPPQMKLSFHPPGKFSPLPQINFSPPPR